MVKKERFAVIGKVKVSMTGELDDVVVATFDGYPTDEMLETVWFESNQRQVFDKVYYLKVEKQVRFE